ncbi:glycosyl transferase family 2 [Geodermatophilus sp. TF02-6]|uniref:glycosyltransferase n=1 Tax=Geodermatophilus sp. TF02-6 TaxID=2250575 RepID=UPI000DEB54E3|nr:glycosyltransferase [Geodermatophilus sp. TF02-6]RBY78370.1 glycosyl transferase family 2 [Geodermatophilus sp. TF02-6]
MPAYSRPVADLEVAIPAYNEVTRLPQTLWCTVEYLRRQPWSSRVVVVDNGSCDGTADVVRAHTRRTDGRVPVDLVGCARPGKGAAVRRALLSSRSRFVGFFDADLATPVETLATVMEHLEDGAQAVIGSRYTAGARFVHAQPAARRLGGAAFRLMARSLVKGVDDTQCGFKFFERHTVTHALVTCRTTGFAFDVELLCQLQRAGVAIVEIPVAWSHADESSFSPWRDGLASFSAVRRMQRSTTGCAS